MDERFGIVSFAYSFTSRVLRDITSGAWGALIVPYSVKDEELDENAMRVIVQRGYYSRCDGQQLRGGVFEQLRVTREEGEKRGG